LVGKGGMRYGWDRVGIGKVFWCRRSVWGGRGHCLGMYWYSIERVFFMGIIGADHSLALH
jgi:hypothetical protein